MVALPTTRNSAYDVIVAIPSGTKHANIQLKTSSKRVTFFPMPVPENIEPELVITTFLFDGLIKKTGLKRLCLLGAAREKQFVAV